MSQLPEKMSAVVCHGPQDYRFEQVPTPLPKAKELVIKVEGCGICAGDCKCKNGAQMFWGENPWVKPPVVPGHEFMAVLLPWGKAQSRSTRLANASLPSRSCPAGNAVTVSPAAIGCARRTISTASKRTWPRGNVGIHAFFRQCHRAQDPGKPQP